MEHFCFSSCVLKAAPHATLLSVLAEAWEFEIEYRKTGYTGRPRRCNERRTRYTWAIGANPISVWACQATCRMLCIHVGRRFLQFTCTEASATLLFVESAQYNVRCTFQSHGRQSGLRLKGLKVERKGPNQ